ncbi:MAG: sigma 54-interacting transcriptional regulator [Planctomycetota bacterium]
MHSLEVICLDERAVPGRVPLQDSLDFGRDPHCDVRLLAEAASRFHARLVRSDRGVELQDLDSRHGLMVNGRPSRGALLQDGDCFGLGGVTFVLSASVPSGGSRVHLDEGLSLQATATEAPAPTGGSERFAALLQRLTPLPVPGRQRMLALSAERLVKADASALIGGGDRLAGSMPAALARRLVAGPRPALLQLGAQLHGATIARAAIGSALSVPVAAELYLVCSRGLDADPFTAADLHRLQALAQAVAPAFPAPDPACGELVGSSPIMRQLRTRILRLARSEATVLITGPSGSGKELVAQALHRASSRRGGPFIAVNCAAIATSLFEAELFGSRKGAFTGADTDRPGRFQAADGGTLFLDEVGELPPDQQAKLLRALQSGSVEPVGGEQAVPVNVRVLAATNRDLEQAVSDGGFRADLYYRLDVLRIRVPGLEERLQDLPELASHLIAAHARREGLEPLALEPAALSALQAAPWPGQVRQLGNLLHRALVLAEGDRIAIDDLELDLLHRQQPSDPEHFPSLAAVEAMHIAAALQRCQDNKSAAARLLGISRPTLYKKVTEYGL